MERMALALRFGAIGAKPTGEITESGAPRTPTSWMFSSRLGAATGWWSAGGVATQPRLGLLIQAGESRGTLIYAFVDAVVLPVETVQVCLQRRRLEWGDLAQQLPVKFTAVE